MQPASPELVYELQAIMIHKGGSATQGHYGGWGQQPGAWL
jgi:uncharacterized UBP type Zn finger protein